MSNPGALGGGVANTATANMGAVRVIAVTALSVEEQRWHDIDIARHAMVPTSLKRIGHYR